MQVFSATFNQMLVLFIFMAIGFLLNIISIVTIPVMFAIFL